MKFLRVGFSLFRAPSARLSGSQIPFCLWRPPISMREWWEGGSVENICFDVMSHLVPACRQRESRTPRLSFEPRPCLGHPFLGEGSPTKIDGRKEVGSLILSSLLDPDAVFLQGAFRGTC